MYNVGCDTGSYASSSTPETVRIIHKGQTSRPANRLLCVVFAITAKERYLHCRHCRQASTKIHMSSNIIITALNGLKISI